MDIKGSVVLITGTARIGAEVAVSLARLGSRVALSYRNSKAAAEDAASRIGASGGEAITLQGDLTNPDDARGIIDRAAAHFGRLDVLINTASLYRKTPVGELDAQAWDANMAVDARAAYLTSLAAARHMTGPAGGRIINFTDWLAASGRPRYKDYAPYYAAKSAVLGLTEALALEFAPRILVNAIAPGPILPPADLPAEEVGKVSEATPLGRWGGPDEITRAVVFLIETGFVTGECIRVDGGRHLR